MAGLTPAERVVEPASQSLARRRPLSAGFFGVLTEGFPQLVRVNRAWCNRPPARLAGEWPGICQIRMINDYPLIPDLDAIEDLIEDALNPGEELSRKSGFRRDRSPAVEDSRTRFSPSGPAVAAEPLLRVEVTSRVLQDR